MMANEYKKLYRSRQHRMISGVCGGLGEYFGIDPTLMRILFIAATFIGFGSAILIYLILLIVVPEEPLPETDTSSESAES
jgi:phage shock protein C